ncbi:MAG: prohibitin family protein [Bacillota bacterium]|nr:prohibitin family protein [Bacillota bacterium]
MTSCLTVVDSGEVGIKFNKLAVSQEGTLISEPVSGFVWYWPFTTRVFTYPTYIQRVDYQPFTVTTQDAAVFTMDPMLAYNIDRSRAVDIFSKHRKPIESIEAGYIRTCVYDAYRITANNYKSDSLMSNRAGFEREVRQMLEKSLETDGFMVSEFTSQITPPSSLSQMIEAKNAAVQAALKAENEVKKAEAEAKIAVAKAEGEAKAMRVKADAEAYYNMKISASLTDRIVAEDWIEKWDGKMPSVQSGNGNMMPVINLK